MQNRRKKTAVDAAWIAEAQRRYEEIRTGKIRTEPATEVFRRLRQSLRLTKRA